MQWIKDNKEWILVAAFIVAWLGVFWLINGNGTIKTWTAKPFSQATCGDVASLILLGAFIARGSK